jgi:hypothetical protein
LEKLLLMNTAKPDFFNFSKGDTEERIAEGRERHTADIMAKKELACLVAGIRLD